MVMYSGEVSSTQQRLVIILKTRVSLKGVSETARELTYCERTEMPSSPLVVHGPMSDDDVGEDPLAIGVQLSLDSAARRSQNTQSLADRKTVGSSLLLAVLYRLTVGQLVILSIALHGRGGVAVTQLLLRRQTSFKQRSHHSSHISADFISS